MVRPTDDELERVAKDCAFAAQVMRATGTYEIRQPILDEAAAMLRACKGRVDFQDRVAPWMQECFGPEISADRLERGDRFLEEALELLQSGGYTPERARALIEYVWARPVGDPAQEVGGVMVTLAAYCLAHDLDMHEAAEIELSHIWTDVDKIRAKHAAKPRGSALPVALEPAPDQGEWDAAIEAVGRLRGRNVQKHHAEDVGEAYDLAIDEAQDAIRALKKGPNHE